MRISVCRNTAPGRVRFKIADGGWTPTCNRGARQPDGRLVLGEAFDLYCNNMSHDVTLDLSTEATAQPYAFEVNAVVPVRPTVTVSRMDQIHSSPAHL